MNDFILTEVNEKKKNIKRSSRTDVEPTDFALWKLLLLFFFNKYLYSFSVFIGKREAINVDDARTTHVKRSIPLRNAQTNKHGTHGYIVQCLLEQGIGNGNDKKTKILDEIDSAYSMQMNLMRVWVEKHNEIHVHAAHVICMLRMLQEIEYADVLEVSAIALVRTVYCTPLWPWKIWMRFIAATAAAATTGCEWQ